LAARRRDGSDTLALLAFTFGLASSRFDVRRGQHIEVANEIGTSSLRGRLLPEPRRTEVRTILLRASVRRHRRAQGDRSMLRSMTPKRARRPFDASVDPIEARNK
jgi:hypothetical protein